MSLLEINTLVLGEARVEWCLDGTTVLVQTQDIPWIWQDALVP